MEENRMADAEQSTVENETTPTPADVGDPSQLGDPGKRALDAERERADAAEKAFKAMKKRIDDLEAEKLSKEERAAKERDEAIAERDAAIVERLRYMVAARYSLSDEDTATLLTGTDEETLVKQAERITALQASKQPFAGLHVPVEGRSPAAPALNSDNLEGALRKIIGAH